jgi:hypothetical protein
MAALLAAIAVPSLAAPAAKLSKWQQHEQEMFRDSAPADEYFGRMKMSYLGMNNTFRDASISSGDHTTDTRIANKIALAEDALEDWAHKYPRDPQLARTYYLATVVERKIWLQPNQDRAWIYLHRLVTLFPDSYFGKHLKADLAIGFTEHYYAAALSCVPLANASDPTPTPAPSPKPVTLEPGRRLVVLAQPCIPVPSPSPSPVPTIAPSPLASATPGQGENGHR